MQSREKLSQDEPRCAVLRTENEEITAYLISCKERQMAMLEVIKSLKQEKAECLKRKVRICLFIRSFCLMLLQRVGERKYGSRANK